MHTAATGSSVPSTGCHVLMEPEGSALRHEYARAPEYCVQCMRELWHRRGRVSDAQPASAAIHECMSQWYSRQAAVLIQVHTLDQCE